MGTWASEEGNLAGSGDFPRRPLVPAGGTEERESERAPGRKTGPHGAEKASEIENLLATLPICCLVYTLPSPRDSSTPRMPSSA